MSLYNMLFGKNPLSNALLEILGLTQADVGRFRDCYTVEEDGKPVIAVYTRNGGGNREHYNDEVEAGDGCNCTGCTICYQLPKHPLYLRDQDDEFDCTYATVFFKVPEPSVELVKTMAGLPGSGDVAPGERFKALIEKLQAGDENDPDVSRALAVGEKIFSALSSMPNGGAVAVGEDSVSATPTPPKSDG